VGGHEIAPQLRAPVLHHPARWRFPQPAKAQRARAPAQLKGNAHAQRERGAAGGRANLPVGVCAAELNHLPRMRLEATRPREFGSDARRTQCFLWPRCYAQPSHGSSAGPRRAPAAIGGRACIHARRRSRRAVTRERRRTRSRRSTCPRLTPRLRGHGR